jgi:phospho-N-acetylmuramoyl-pentapeptide-transferase
MRAVLYASTIALICSLIGTPIAIKTFTRLGYGQEVRTDGVQRHLAKQGTPTMGGTVIVLSALVAYFLTKTFTWQRPTASVLLVLLLMAGMGAVGFVDDFIKIHRRRSLGLRAKAKLVGQWLVTIVFAVLALRFRNSLGLTPASDHISFLHDIGWLGLGPVLFVLWSYLLTAGWSNAVNLTDGLDGLCAGASAMAFAAYVVVGVWQYGQSCGTAGAAGCYEVRDPLDLAVVAASVMGACFGFLWWNAAPAKIFMGDTGALGLGGAFAGLSICTRTEVLAVIVGGLFVMELLSVVIQVGSFKLRHGKRVFKITPIHHHFEMLDWPEVNITIRFWIISGLCVVLGLGVFYGGYAAQW